MNNRGIINYIFTRPFRAYGRMGGIVFGIVTASNFASMCLDNNRRNALIEHPQIFTVGIISKAAYFGVFWPGFVVTTMKDPRETLVFCPNV